MKITFLSAGAGSGKTWNLTETLYKRLSEGIVNPESIIATTFTIRAANELLERVRRRLLEDGRRDDVNRLSSSYIGTVNSVCQSLLERFAFEAGLPPKLEVLDEHQAPALFAQVFEDVVDLKTLRDLMPIKRRFGYLDARPTDWLGDIKKIVDYARSNDIAPHQLDDCAKSSLESLFKLFPKPSADDIEEQLSRDLTALLEVIEQNGCRQKNTMTYVGRAQNALQALKYGALKWYEWVFLAKTIPSAKFREAAEPVQTAASRYEVHPLLREDITNWTNTCFQIAASAMGAYQEEKEKKGFIDFIDQEQRCLKLLDNELVQEQLSEELDLLMVDEFQDTSPIQLALFTKLCRYANETIWVGDPKQAIYGFRGSDPELMDMVVQGVKGTDVELTDKWLGDLKDRAETEVKILDTSRRSTAPLVELVNNLFVPAFSDFLKPEEVELKPFRTDEFDQPPLAFWNLKKGRGFDPRQGLSCGVRDLLSSGRKIFDKESKAHRGIKPSDIAILCRTNANCHALAQHLNNLSVPVEVARPGLMDTSEVVLTLAYLRFWFDPTDSLAQAEVVALESGLKAEEWLSDRIRHVQDSKPSYEWGYNDSLKIDGFIKLSERRNRQKSIGPVEALNEIINTAEVEKTVIAWCKSSYQAEQRLNNLRVLQDLSIEYEGRCEGSTEPATIAGMLKWFSELSEGGHDYIASNRSTNAVQVLTHHRSKGLEWPIVISTDLDAKIRHGHWGVNVSNGDGGTFDDPLKDRGIRYWVWPFGSQAAGVPISERSIESEIGKEAYDASVRENKRLLYVSFTRARDQLVIATAGKWEAQHWLHCIEAQWLVPGNRSVQTPSGSEIPVDSILCDQLATPVEETATFQPIWYSLSPNEVRISKFASPSLAEKISGATITTTEKIGDRMQLKAATDMGMVGNAVHDIMALFFDQPDIDENRVSDILKRHHLENVLNTAEVIRSAKNLRDWLINKFNASKLQSEVPIMYKNKLGQLVNGSIDLLVNTNDGVLIIDHKTFPGSQEQAKEKAVSYSGQLAAYREGLEACGLNVTGTLIYFPTIGQLVGINLS